MQRVGEIRYGREIGKTPYHKYIWHACEGCGKLRWVRIKIGLPKSVLCQSCGWIKPERLAALSKASSERKGDKSAMFGRSE